MDIDGRVYTYVEAHSKDGSIKLSDKKSIIGTPVTKTSDKGEDIVIGYIMDVVDDFIICKMKQLDFKPVSINFEKQFSKGKTE